MRGVVCLSCAVVGEEVEGTLEMGVTGEGEDGGEDDDEDAKDEGDGEGYGAYACACLRFGVLVGWT